jgi:hypothetical protein
MGAIALRSTENQKQKARQSSTITYHMVMSMMCFLLHDQQKTNDLLLKQQQFLHGL